MIDIEKLVGQVSNDFKQGSSRIVYFPENKKTIILDGIETEIETVLKVAKRDSDSLIDRREFGQLQNKIEIKLNKSKFSLYTKNFDGSYSTNDLGILAPILNCDPNNDWIEMVRVINPMTIPIFNKFTGGENFPAGLHFDQAKLAIRKHYNINYDKDPGISYPKLIDDEKYQFIIQHPWIKIYDLLMAEFDIDPSDFVLKNLGYIINPVTKKENMVLCDYGLTYESSIIY
jgi:hypothetical protein